MSSKPVTPLEQRRAYPGESETTRIPMLSPQPFRRSYSLRMRTSRSFHDYQHYRTECCDCECIPQQQQQQQQQQQLASHPSNLVMQGSGVKPKPTAGSSPHGAGSSSSNIVSKSISHGHQHNYHQQQQQRSPMANADPSTADTIDELDSFAVQTTTGKDGTAGGALPNGGLVHGGHSEGLFVNCLPSSSPSASSSRAKGPSGQHQKQQQYQQQPPGVQLCCLHGASRKTSLTNLHKHERGMSLNLINSGHSSGSSQRTPRTPQTPSGTAGVGLQRAGGVVGGLSPKTPPVSPESPVNSYLDDDLDSLHSYSSVASGMSCDHPYVARNGTTFSGRKMKYVVHCSSHAGQTGGDYLTPTQRAQRQIRRLKELLSQARCDLEQRDSEILRLTKEVVELRLFKASLSSPEERSNSSDAVTVRENTTNDVNTPSSSQDISPIVDQVDDGVVKASPRHQHHHMQAGIHQVQFIDKLSTSEMQGSFADSGHFEDMTTSSIHSKDSYVHTQDRACGSDEDMDAEKKRLIALYEERIEELIKQHQTEEQQLRTSNNDRFEVLLQKLAESNTRYCDLVPDYEQAKERIRELEKQLETLQAQLAEQEDKANKMYLHMYAKGQEAERQEQADRVIDMARASPSRVSVPELMQQLQVTQDELENIKTMYKRLIDAQQTKNKVDPEVTLQFLKSAIYYFLTDKENSQGHLNAIESILGFSDAERSSIDKARAYK
uniref:GRIP domain-containing protein n=1 Tax=Anopheles atroparvus TaxID=41427 RepID=A0AAG5DRB2_ANOAO